MFLQHIRLRTERLLRGIGALEIEAMAMHEHRVILLLLLAEAFGQGGG
jgi:hypothetical protein